MSDQMRAEFEAWFEENKGFMLGTCKVSKSDCFFIWQASRESAQIHEGCTAAAQGFRDGVASKSEPCDGCFMAEAEALRKNSDRYLHLKATWDDGLLLERLGGNVLPADWDAEIDKDISKEV